jgi:hypothetical protein
MDKERQIVIRELNTIPADICLDMRTYKMILFQLVRNSIQYSTKKAIVLIDLHYFEV